MSNEFLDRVQLEHEQCPNVAVCDGAHGPDCVALGYSPPHVKFERLIDDGPRTLADGRHSRAATVDDLRRQVDELTAVLARREAEDARNERVLSVLRRLRSALPERIRYELSTDSLRLLNALDAADALLVEVER